MQVGVRQVAHPQQPCKFGYIFEPDFPPGQNGDEEVYEEGFFFKGWRHMACVWDPESVQ